MEIIARQFIEARTVWKNTTQENGEIVTGDTRVFIYLMFWRGLRNIVYRHNKGKTTKC